MSGKSHAKKDLYLSSNMGALNKMTTLPDVFKTKPAKLLQGSANKCFDEAEKYFAAGDDERAYLLFMKYFNIIQLIKTSKDYRAQKDFFDKCLSSTKVEKAISTAEKLSKSLKKRYDLKEAELLAKRLTEKDLERVSEDLEKTTVNGHVTLTEDDSSGVPSGPATDTAASVEPSIAAGSVTPIQLYNLMQDGDSKVLIMDTRPATDYKRSHIRFDGVINVPEDIINVGTTVKYIEERLPADSRNLWTTRGSVDYVVLLDSKSTLSDVTPGRCLKTLRDALYKFDLKVTLRSEPQILEGGYNNWLLHYPALTTNPSVDHLPAPSSTMAPTTSLLDFDYPDLDEGFLASPQPPTDAEASKLQTVNNAGVTPVSVIPKFDRSKKPASSSMDSLIRPTASVESGMSITSSINSSTVRDTLTTTIPMSIVDNVTVTAQNGPVTNASTVEKTTVDETAKVSKELERLKKENTRVTLEHQARVERLMKEKRELAAIGEKKRKEEEEVENMMRRKSEIEEELKKAEARLQNQLDLDKLQEHKNRQKELDKMREERKKREDEEKEKLLLVEQELAKVTEEQEILNKEKERIADEEKKIEEQRRLEKLRAEKDAEEELAKKAAQDKKLAEEKQRESEKLEAQRREKERLLAEKREKERLESERIEAERVAKALGKERMLKEEAEKRQRESETKLHQVSPPTVNAPKSTPEHALPVGWEKILDRNTNRYYYRNHTTRKTQWEPPAPEPPPTDDKPMAYKTSLKDEPSESTRGLVRSHSSPDISKLVDQPTAHQRTNVPQFSRHTKPSLQQPQSRPTFGQVIAARNRDLNPVYGDVGRALTGLRNLGNTCYMNSTIQCLNNCSVLVAYFLDDLYHQHINRQSVSGYHGEVVDEFAVIVKALWSGKYKSISPRDFKSMCSRYNSTFATFEQQDSQEFLAFLLDALHEGLNDVKKKPVLPEQNNDNVPEHIAAEQAWDRYKLVNKSIIVQLFQGQLKSTVVCLTCNKKSLTFDTFQYLTLPLPSSSRCSLQECLKLFLKEERLSGSSRWNCPQCKTQRDAVKKLDIWKLPNILIIHLNRFFFEGMWRQKLNTNVDFPLTDLDLYSFTAGPNKMPKYNLYAVSNHYGTMEGGHYTAYCKNPSSASWYKFDDTETNDISRSTVKSSAAYFLFYTSV